MSFYFTPAPSDSHADKFEIGQDQACQGVAVDGSGVDANLVGKHEWTNKRGMSEYDPSAEILL
jgi:hypothetical protein